MISVEECVSKEKAKQVFYLNEQEQKLLTEVVIEAMGSEDGSPKGDKTQLQQQGKESYSQKRIHSGFMRVTEEVIDNKNS